MTLLLLSAAGLILATIPALMFFANLPLFQETGVRTLCSDGEQGTEEAAPTAASDAVQVSVLIPARDEAAGIAETLACVLRSRSVELEVLVLDDHSSDDTAEIVRAVSETDPRAGCLAGLPLPAGWNGKQFACAQLAAAANYPRLLFLDADVRLAPDALGWMVQRQDEKGVSLLSIFPHQQTGTWLEQWLIPLMHWILLGFLPFRRMRQSNHPAYAAGCGQVFMSHRSDYEQAGTHAAILRSRHDGVKLPRVFREAGLMTDVLDGSQHAECRMYRSGAEVIRGVLKNAVEGIANPKLIVPFTIILLGGALLPWLTLAASLWAQAFTAAAISLVAILIGYAPRMVAVTRLRQPFAGAVCHPLAVTLFVILQWIALLQHRSGRQVAWRGRS